MRANIVGPLGHETETAPLKRTRRLLVIILCVVALIAVPLSIGLTPDTTTETVGKPLTYADSPLFISEYMTSNGRYYDTQGDAADWIEVQNGGTEPLQLRGFALVQGDKSFVFPSLELDAGGFAVVWLDGGGNTAWHAPFKLNAEGGETVYLKNGDGDVVDEITTTAMGRNTSITRAENTDGTFAATACDAPTPGFENSEAGVAEFIATRYATENTTGLRLNEIVASNGSLVADEFGGFVDYIEILNTTDDTLDIGGIGISDNPENTLKWVFPKGTKLKGGACVIVFLSAEYETVAEDGTVTLKESATGAFLAPFGLKKEGEKVHLTDKTGFFVDWVDTGALQKDQALVRQADGSWAKSFDASPAFPNTAEGAAMSRPDTAPVAGDIIISEASSRNNAYLEVDDAYYDWIELFNPTDKPICLAGYALSDDLATPQKYILPDVTLEAGGYLVVFATDKQPDDVLATGFNLNGSSFAALFSPKGQRLDYVRLTELPLNVSKGRTPETGNQWVYFETPTPKKPNGKGVSRIATRPTADKASGNYTADAVLVSLGGEGDIHYTLDGSVPTARSPRYTGTLALTHTTVVRAVSIAPDAVPSAVMTASYIINENHTVDVLSLVCEPDDLFSEDTGIYATGHHASSTFPYKGANFWQDWEKHCTIELLPQGGDEAGFIADGGLSIFGAYTRAYEKKAFKVRFRDIYGAGKLNYAVFDNRDFAEYESIVIRPGGQDTFRCMMKDDMTTTLADGILDVMASRPVILYINGDYYGVYYIREKISEHFIASHYGVSPESVDLLQGNGYTVNAGDNADWLALMDYVKDHDLTVDEHYQYVADRVDLQNFADWQIAELYCGNTDQGNIRFFRSSENDGKWRWIFYDTDLGFQGGNLSSAWELLNPNGTGAGDAISTRLINKLLKNKNFRALFVERLEYQMKNIWNTERVRAEIDRFAAIWEPEADRNSIRWEHSTVWADNVWGLHYFARNRMDALRDEFEDSARVRNIIALTDEELDRCFPETV